MTVLGDISIRRKIVAISVGVAALGVVLAAALLMLEQRHAMRRSHRDNVGVLAASVAEYAVASLVFEDREGAQAILAKLASLPSVRSAALLDSSGTLVASFVRPDATLPALPIVEREALVRHDASTLVARHPVRHQERVIGSLHLAVSTADVDAALRRETYAVLGVGTATLCLCVLLALRLARYVAEPVRRLAEAVERVRKGDMSERVEPAGRDELGTLSAGFNRMLDQIQERGAERDRLREQLQQAQKMEAVGQLAGGIAHDFNNLLTGILGYAELLQLPGAQLSPADAGKQIALSCQRAADLVARLMAFSRHKPTARTPQDLNEIVLRVRSLLEHTIDRRIRLEVDLAERPCVVEGDVAQLESAIMNLALNARDAMPSGGTLQFRTRHIQVGPSSAPQALPPGAYVELEVIDTGQGIAPEHLDRIFEPFFTTKPLGKGTGLGLAVVYGTARSHGGSLDVRSSVGKGTVASLRLPRSEARPTRATPAPPPPRGRAHVLVVDDEQQVLDVASGMLRHLGYEVSTATGGEEAVALLRAHPGSVDLALLDVMMPGMDGVETLEALRTIKPALRAAFMSGFNTKEPGTLPADVERLQKPFTLETLSRTLSQLLPATEAQAPRAAEA